MMMKKILQILYLAVSLIGVTPAHADAFEAAGAGSMTCMQHNAMVKQGGKLMDATYFAWAQGFLSGINVTMKASGHQTKDLSSIDPEQQQKLLDAFCLVEPSKMYLDAVTALFMQFSDAKDDE